MFLEGLLLTLSLITSIGPQNTFVLKQGLTRNHLFATAFSVSFCNSLSITAGVLGLGRFLTDYPTLKLCLIWAGILFLSGFVVRSFFLVFKGQSLSLQNKNALSLKKTILHGILFSWANPLTLLESLGVLGSVSAQYDLENALLFGKGCIAGTFLWFFFLTYASSFFHAYAQRPLTWKVINFLTGCICSWATYSLLQHALNEC